MRQLRGYGVELERQTQPRDKGAPNREMQKIDAITASLADGCVAPLWADSRGKSTSSRDACCLGGKDDDEGAERYEWGESIGSISVRR